MSIVALFDMSGNSVRDWAQAGETCYCLDIVNDGKIENFTSGGSIEYLNWDARGDEAFRCIIMLKPKIIFSFPPCTDLAVSGAKHFANKAKANPSYLQEALELVIIGPKLAKFLEIPCYVENPVGVLSSVWLEPSNYFNPCDYGGYLPEDDKHPQWPQYINPRDAYNKKTCIWRFGGLIWPYTKPVKPENYSQGFSKQTAKLGGKSLKTKQIRSMTPRGWAKAVFLFNYTKVTGKQLPNQ